ncbi:ABC transporter permease [Paenibacillus sp. 1A_MP2]|uniref:ABC transporter permease n=1 Tax=Paenibacillus sp. 1A_MP2 TaxID=3457495 RepID=UPI003FCD0B87
MFIGFLSIIAGIGGGMLLSKLFLMLTTRFIGMDDLPFYFPVKAMLITVIAFLLLFFCISLFTLFFIGNKRALELLTGTSKPKKEPKASWVFSILGLAFLATGFIALYSSLSSKSILIAAVTGIAGTYFFYSQLSVLTIRLLKRNRKRVWHGTRLLWISEMSYKIKDNARMLFMVTVVIAIASMSAVVILSLDQQNRQVFRDNHFPIRYNVYNASEEPNMAPVNEVLDAAGLPYQDAYLEYFWTSADGNGISVMPLSDFNQFNAIQNKPSYTLASHTGIFIDSRNMEKPRQQERFHAYAKGDQLTLDTKSEPAKIDIKYTEIEPEFNGLLYASALVIVNDEEFNALAGQMDKDAISGKYLYHIPSWGKPCPIGNHLKQW